jgi:hypothetical protein
MICFRVAVVTLLGYSVKNDKQGIDVLGDDSIRQANSYCVGCALDISERTKGTAQFANNPEIVTHFPRLFTLAVLPSR